MLYPDALSLDWPVEDQHQDGVLGVGVLAPGWGGGETLC